MLLWQIFQRHNIIFKDLVHVSYLNLKEGKAYATLILMKRKSRILQGNFIRLDSNPVHFRSHVALDLVRSVPPLAVDT